MSNPPTDRQLAYLGRLGYALTPPTTWREASDTLTALEEGKTPKAAEAVMLKAREQRKKKAVRESEAALRGAKSDLKDIAKLMREDPDLFRCAGFVLTAYDDEPDAKVLYYEGAFVPFALAWQRPELLVIDGLSYEEVETPPRSGRVMQSNGQVVEMAAAQRAAIGKGVRRVFGCVVGLAFAIVAAVVIIIVASIVGSRR
jgi:hypothetical protein